MFQKTKSTEIRKIKHDMNNNLTAISVLLDDNDIPKTISYINELTSRINSIGNTIKTGDSIIDAIINYKITVSKEFNIDFKTDIAVLPQLDYNSTDLCAIISNLLDNAIEATIKLEENKRSISIKMFTYKNYVTIIIKNSHANEIKISDNLINTSKDNDIIHGFGLKSVSAAVLKYSGLFKISNDENTFQAEVMLPIK